MLRPNMALRTVLGIEFWIAYLISSETVFGLDNGCSKHSDRISRL